MNSACISLTHEGSAFLEDCQRLLSDVANAGVKRYGTVGFLTSRLS
ncbi:hypothetical protein [Acidovorax sp.]|nr:hypothetical protein [Acidovorax sp.]